MLVGTVLQLIFPFLSQSIVDYGIGNNNLGFVTVILIAQLTLYVAQTSVEFIRSWILLHISTRINISIISDFLIKMMKLPIGFFDTKPKSVIRKFRWYARGGLLMTVIRKSGLHAVV